ncbi:MAG: helix-turn-helix domain-containing protein [Bacteroidaceae bacterium]|nr:helix-turn-helix domain-containing protein [Bacteroidaceae bacterium]MBQ8695310.1 helix-turn-helix domain-containing protein [Bacteroidaceae bacterium]
MNNIYLKKLPQYGFATIQSSLQQFVQRTYQMQHSSIFYCLSGEALFTIDGHKYRFTPGQIIICPMGSNILLLDITSDFQARLLGLSKHIWLAARSTISPEVMQTIERRTHQGGNSELEKEFVSNIFRQIDIIDSEVDFNVKNTDYCRKCITMSVTSLLLYIQHISENNSAEPKESLPESKDKLFFEFRTLLGNNFREERSVQFYADRLKISTRHLNSVCQRASGQNAKEIIDHYTIIELQVALMYSHKSFQELVNEFKFPDQSYLNRYFKRHTGYSLSEFRTHGVMVD